MAPADPRCAALAAAKAKKGMSYAQIAGAIGSQEQRVIDVCTGNARPTEAEFKSLATALGMSDNVAHSGVHATA